MTIEEFNRRVARAQTEHPLWFDLPTDAAVDESSLLRLERELGCRFPKSFRWFLSRFGGGDFALVSIYSGDPRSDLYLGRNQTVEGGDFVAISDDGTGNLIGFPIVNGVCEDRIVVADHESGEVRDSEQDWRFFDWVAEVGLGG